MGICNNSNEEKAAKQRPRRNRFCHKDKILYMAFMDIKIRPDNDIASCSIQTLTPFTLPGSKKERHMPCRKES
tara:strand:+ start:1009 stop:1227 length:219 start_codon:yes stop_codon:yes gene_type:complete